MTDEASETARLVLELADDAPSARDLLHRAARLLVAAMAVTGECRQCRQCRHCGGPLPAYRRSSGVTDSQALNMCRYRAIQKEDFRLYLRSSAIESL